MRSSRIPELGTVSPNPADPRSRGRGTRAALRAGMRIILLGLALAGCKADDLLADLPDAAVEPDAVTLPAGHDWTCLDEDWEPVSAGAVTVSGGVFDNFGVGIGGATVEILDGVGGAQLGQGVSSNLPASRGRYSISITTDGSGPVLLRKVTALGRIDGYQVDPTPVTARFLEARVPMSSLTAEQLDGFYGALLGDPGARDPAKGEIAFDVHDCAGVPVGGAIVEVEGAAAIGYTSPEGQIGAGTGQTETSAEFGGGVILGLDPGMVDVTVRVGGLTYRAWPVPVFASSVTESARMP